MHSDKHEFFCLLFNGVGEMLKIKNMVTIFRNTTNGVIWTRVSTKRQEDNGGSLDFQEKICREYAERHGINIVGKVFGGTHESAKVPGKLFKEMINAVKKDHSISFVLCSEFDRLSRQRGMAISLMDELREMGVVLIEAKTGTDTKDRNAALMACFKFSTATWDNENRGDKFYSGRKHCYAEGAYTGVLPKGYYREGKSLSSVCKLNDEGHKIAKAFKWKLEGYSNSEILAKLKVLGLDITKQSLNHYFNNPFYAGKIRSKLVDEGMVDGNIEPAVSYGDWQKIQKIMSCKSGKYKHAKKQEKFPLKHFVFCAECQTPFTAYTVKAKNCDYYKCNKIGCGTNVAARKLHDSYISVLEQIDIPLCLIMQYENVLRRMIKSCEDDNVKYATLLKKQRTEKEKDLASCKRRFATGEMKDENIYREVTSLIQEEIAKIDAELEKYQENLSNLDTKVHRILVTCSKLSSLWKESDLETKQKIQKLTFPNGIFWDKENGSYRTDGRNEVYDILERISVDYKQKEEENPLEFSSSVQLCAG